MECMLSLLINESKQRKATKTPAWLDFSPQQGHFQIAPIIASTQLIEFDMNIIARSEFKVLPRFELLFLLKEQVSQPA